MLSLSAIAFGIATVLTTLIGGRIALRFKRYLNPLIAFCGGTLIALSLLELIPNGIEYLDGKKVNNALLIVLVSFIAFHILDKLILIHGHSHSEECSNKHKQKLGITVLSGLILHSFLDGFIIGAGFLIDNSTGILVSSIVLLHRLADGLNTVTLSVKNKHPDNLTVIFLVLNSLAPIIGLLMSGLFNISGNSMGIIFCIFSGFFLYLGASDLLPEAHKERSSVSLILFTLVGCILVGFVSFIVG